MTTTETATSTEAAPELGTLTADDLAALRMADGVAFSLYQGRYSIRTYIGSLGSRTIFTVKQQLVFNDTTNTGAGERARLIPTQGTAYGYGYQGNEGGWNHENSPNAGCFHLIQSARFDPAWTTVASLLRAGDVVTLKWGGDNNTETIVSHGLHVDDLYLVVTRGKRKLTFHVARSVGPNNSARMIRRHGRF